MDLRQLKTELNRMKNILKIKTIYFFFIFVALSSCETKQKAPKVISPNGLWKQLGYGKTIEIKDDSVKIFDISKMNCTLFEESLLAEIGKVESFSKDSLIVRKNIKTYKFVRIDKLPSLCEEAHLINKNPIHNFETLWNTYKEHYCFFEQRNVDWDAVYKTYKPKITEETGELELYQILDEMLSALNDGHARIFPPDYLGEELKKIKKETKADSNKPEVDEFELELKAQAGIANFYCKNVQSHNAGIAKWGMMKDSVGYIQINAMLFLAFYDIPKGLSFQETWGHYAAVAEERTFQRQDEIDGSVKLMDIILSDLKAAKALVLDLRFNIGGKDEVGLEIIGRFVQEQTLVARKKTKLGEGFTNRQAIYLEPKTPNFLGNVYVLTSHETASAAELASIATQTPKNIIRIGSNTEGIFSDQLDKKLPNGWDYVLSNEIYENSNGDNYENIGVPPDFKIDYPKESVDFYTLLLKQIAEGGDQAIEQVFLMEAGN